MRTGEVLLWFYYFTISFCRNLPLGIIIGIPIVAVCYILVNIAFFAGLSRHEIVNTQSIGSVITSFRTMCQHSGSLIIRQFCASYCRGCMYFSIHCRHLVELH